MNTRLCIKCRELPTADPLGVCERCQRANALSFADCGTCTATAEFDSDGRVIITHEPGCRDFAEFRRQVEDIENTSSDTE